MVYLSFFPVSSVHNINICMSKDGLTRDTQPLRDRSTSKESISCIIGDISNDGHSSVHDHRFGFNHGGFYHGGPVPAIFYIGFA